ncbi:thioesterase II family protein [Chryseobacterium sp. KLBC 52]|uniref:thioesterase II family protein n=1 Tax=Chryseobacterium sp. KLBC 52 TaxID=1862702 RepID=UPI001E57616E|nr:thioesterase domain-containing protein [Chryseobacterium sp. KLBC 52]
MNIKPQLFLFHFAGGNCYSYSFLKEYLEECFDFIPLELPGRGKRMSEPLLKTRSQVISDLVWQVRTRRNTNVPFILYGHSMGAGLGLDIAKHLEQSGDPAQTLVVSGNAGPRVYREKKMYLLPDEEFKKELENLGGISSELLENDELYMFLEPILRADFEIVDIKDEKIPSALKSTSIIALMGTGEENAENIDNWRNYTSQSFTKLLLEGDHFFIYNHPVELAAQIKKAFGNIHSVSVPIAE